MTGWSTGGAAAGGIGGGGISGGGIGGRSGTGTLGTGGGSGGDSGPTCPGVEAMPSRVQDYPRCRTLSDCPSGFDYCAQSGPTYEDGCDRAVGDTMGSRSKECDRLGCDCGLGKTCVSDGSCYGNGMVCATGCSCPDGYHCARVAGQVSCLRGAASATSCDGYECPVNQVCTLTSEPTAYCRQKSCTSDTDCDCGACVRSSCCSRLGLCIHYPRAGAAGHGGYTGAAGSPGVGGVCATGYSTGTGGVVGSTSVTAGVRDGG